MLHTRVTLFHQHRYSLYAFVFSILSVQGFISSMIPSSVNSNTAVSYHPTSRRGVRKVRVSDLVAVILLVYILWWNVGTVNSDLQMSSGNQWLGQALRIDQWWSMFAPYPFHCLPSPCPSPSPCFAPPLPPHPQ